MKIVIAGGGTGGHLFPGIAVAEEIMKRDSSAEVVFIGTEHGIEASIIPAEGYAIKFLRAEGLVGKPLLKKMRAGIKTFFSVADSYKLVKGLSPDIVIGLGGYASFGPVFTGCLMSVPTVIMEQNSVPGLANKILGRIADAVCVTYHQSASFFPRYRTFITGNPVRHRIGAGSRETAYKLFNLRKDKFTVLVFGGSSGARRINGALCEAFSHLTDLKEKIQFLHQTGRADYETVREAYRKWGFSGTVAGFINQMPEAYAAADIIVSRAGATTLAELTAVGKAAILIPYPYAAGDHQEQNALKLFEMGAAGLIAEHELSGEILAGRIRELHGNDGMRFEMQRQCKSLGRVDAAQKVADIVMSLIKNRQASGSKKASRRVFDIGQGTGNKNV